MEYQVKKSKRKSISISIQPDGSVLVRAPYFLSDKRIDRFVHEKEDWIIANVKKVKEKNRIAENISVLSDEEIKALRKKAKIILPAIVKEYADILGVTYGNISVKKMSSRWGSCSEAGNLNFNLALMLAPEEVLRYVVIHELCHRIYMNHSASFWKTVATVDPYYKEKKKWLKDNGKVILKKIGK